jgi:serine/threonine protein kinase
MSNNCIKLPIKSLDFDKFVKMFTDEMKITFDNFHKSKNHNKNVKILEESLRKNMKTSITKKQLKDIKILKTILKERDILDKVIHQRNKLFLKKLKSTGVKISDKDTYKTVKKSVIKGEKWKPRQYDLMKKGSKLYFSVNIDLNKIEFGNTTKSITLLEDTNILDKLKFYKKLNNISFIPKIVEVIIIYKNENINSIKVVSEYVKGITLKKHLSKKKLSYEKEEQLKKNIMKHFATLKSKGLRYGSYSMGDDIIIDNNKIYLTGISYLTSDNFNSNESRLEVVFDKDFYFREQLNYADLIIHSLIKKKKLVFK